MDTEVYSVFGRRGCGKSYLGRKIQSRYSRRVIFDSLGEYGDADGFRVQSFDEFSRTILSVHDCDAFSIVVQFNPERKNFEEEFSECLRILYYVRNVQVVIEEVQRYATPHRMDYWLEQLFLVGRHRGISLLCITQRPGLCHKTIISQSGHVYFGQLHEMNDLEYCRSVLYDEAYRLPKLPPRKFLYFAPGLPIRILTNNQV